jgi:hypothetical protein
MSSTTRKAVEELSIAIKLKLKQRAGGNYPIKKLLFDLRESSDRVSHSPHILPLGLCFDVDLFRRSIASCSKRD